MKKIFITALLTLVTFGSFGQSLDYQRLAILFSQDDLNGSARFTALGGAFGALGGDVSSINVNPAGITVFNNSVFSASFKVRDTEISATYGDANFNEREETTIPSNFSNLSQAGGVLVFDSAYESEWEKFAIGFNYRITKDFSNSFLATGNEGFARFNTNPNDSSIPQRIFDRTRGQEFSTDIRGELSELNLAFSAVRLKKLHVGLSLNFYDLNFIQQSILTEFNSDADGNLLDVELFQDNFTSGSGFSANIGFIYKTDTNFRFGLAYQTPTYFSEIIQDSNYNQDSDIDIGDTTFFPQGENSFTETNSAQLIGYNLRTPGKITASAAYIFSKKGLLSIDYINRAYQNLQFTDTNFATENNFFQNELRNTHSVNVGSEWRFDRLSLRGGYRFEQNPDKFAVSSDNLKGYSLGAGYKFKGLQLDIAYTSNNNTDFYNFYPGFNVNDAELDINNKIITASVTINL